MDLNGGLVHSEDDFAAGPHGVGNASPASAAARPVLSAWGLRAANLFFYLNPASFVGERGESHIDHAVAPHAPPLPAVGSRSVHPRSARRLQLHQTVSARDYRPVAL
eukprot:353153-Pyramimonas_sp.AAC.1